MNKDVNAVLIVADISGYTSFMKRHDISISHAKQTIVRLLKAIMNAGGPPLKVAELEGDAVFFYALANGKGIDRVASQVKSQLIDMFAAFKKELDLLSNMKLCSCDACTTVSDLRLKQVVHVGKVEVERIAQFEKLFGLDVILVHRMLKNSVPSKEYVMMTDPVYQRMSEFYGLEPERWVEEFEGIGSVETLVFYPQSLTAPVKEGVNEPSSVSLLNKVSWALRVVPTTLLDLFGLWKRKLSFHNLPA